MAQQISMAELGTLANTYDAIRNAEFFYKVDFTAMNNSEVSGGAFLALDTDSNILTVLTAATGECASSPASAWFSAGRGRQRSELHGAGHLDRYGP